MAKSPKKRKTYKKVKLVSAAATGAFYTTKKPIRASAKLSFRKHDPKARTHCVFKEAKL